MPAFKLSGSITIVAVAVLAFLLLGQAKSQEEAKKQSEIAVIDRSVVFEKYGAFQAEMLKLKAEVEAFEVELKGKQKKFEEMKMRIAEEVNGSEEQKQLQAKMEAEYAALQARMTAERARFLRAESDQYYASYNTVQEVVETLARERSIRLVLRYNSEAIKPAERQSVLQGVNKAVVFQDGLDITQDVIKRLN